MGLRRILSSKVFIFAIGFFLVFVCINLGKEFYRKYQVQQEIDSLQSEVEGLKSSNQQLTELIDYFKTENFAELEARKKLNLQKEDEKVLVVNVSDVDILENEIKTEENVQEIPKEEEIKKQKKSNIQKWWDYFFNKN